MRNWLTRSNLWSPFFQHVTCCLKNNFVSSNFLNNLSTCGRCKIPAWETQLLLLIFIKTQKVSGYPAVGPIAKLYNKKIYVVVSFLISFESLFFEKGPYMQGVFQSLWLKKTLFKKSVKHITIHKLYMIFERGRPDLLSKIHLITLLFTKCWLFTLWVLWLFSYAVFKFKNLMHFLRKKRTFAKVTTWRLQLLFQQTTIKVGWIRIIPHLLHHKGWWNYNL